MLTRKRGAATLKG